MPNVAKVLKEEISRIARKESKALVSPIQLRTLKLERTAGGFRKRLALLEKAAKQLQAVIKRIEASQPSPAPEEQTGRQWISGKGIKGIRKRLGFSQADFAKLVGVSDQAVYNWEKKPGMLKLRGITTKAAILSAREIGRIEALRRLEETAKKVKKTAAKRRKK